MIPFFRKIRLKLVTENKFSKYLIYAIGEIILVVIGILIALQVNNLNIEKNNQKKIENYLSTIVTGLETDILEVQFRIRQMIRIEKRIDSLSSYFADKEIEEIENIDVLMLTWRLQHSPYDWERATIDALQSSGSLNLIRDKTLSKEILDYYTFTFHMDEDFEKDNALTEESTQLIFKVINTNYPNLYGLDSLLLSATNTGGEEVDIFTSSEYKKAKSYDLSLIADELDDLHAGNNSLLKLRYNLKLRRFELGNLINQAENLISTINEVYNFNDDVKDTESPTGSRTKAPGTN